MNTADMIEHGGHAAALAWHLQHNHYPPVPLRMIPACRAAIAAAAAGDWDTLAALPEGVTYQGRNTAPVWAIIEAHHLAPFVDAAEVTPPQCSNCGNEWGDIAPMDDEPSSLLYCADCRNEYDAAEVDE